MEEEIIMSYLYQDAPICYICCDENKTLIDQSIQNIENIPDNSVFKGPCDLHYICKECLIRICLDYENNINIHHSHIRCMNLDWEDCRSYAGVPYYFHHADIKKVLTPSDFDKFIEHASNFEYPGFDTSNCIRCNYKNKISVHDIINLDTGEVTVLCENFVDCGITYCYHCNKQVDDYDIQCNYCIGLSSITNPNLFNKFLIKGDKKNTSMGENSYLYRNKDITVDMALNHILSIINSPDDTFFIQCFICANNFSKSEQCCSLKHCGIERCYSCGKVQDRHSPDGMGNHWSAYGVNGCPRFDTDPYWNTTANCNFKCSEHISPCYGHDIGECQIIEHIDGRVNMVNERKQNFVYHFIKSLLRETRTKVLDGLSEVLDVKKIKKVLEFIDKNPEYFNYYNPVLFMDEMK